ncbi:TonB-dependent siderophore receptor [Acinetobacter sp. C_4_1]|uniref:TonB-dependent receptor n=1 Tax=unclassified Acinetobacter TaxID=196816 RepID=UPI0021B77CCC|nr:MULTISPECIES: TonB-dependent siderophore receptor [unclassified Acinetobacter]MCT8090675.1 TonB-dependent siderophore receptor [Acinetobacter sp. F_3_1]MCT8099153.1 TonB-dependent siderophore receptor [Acinetobacter sp. C_3_1]MCT8102226.1 TonB-dependent siderophore receptor [Acinetobacter sp. C_4_1]MCT8135973.1 TonB-dependent siderophore receptor [Acinetobacter sp. T_3_1]
MAFIKTRKKIVSSAIVSSLSVMAANAFAQDQVAQLETIHAQAEAETAQGLKVDQSANSKFVAPLLDTPKSVSVISKQLIEDTQVTTLSDALRTVPGITLGAGEGGNPNGDRPFIRGYNSESSMYVDGVRNATSQNREMFAVEQVEVTKGSASAMGGAGTTGGSVNMISKVAKKGDSLEGSVGAGTDSYQRITLDGNKDFGNGIAARVAVMGHHNEKAGQADGTEYKRAGIAPSITFGLDTPTRATLSYYYLKTDDTPDSGVPYNNPTGYSQYSGKPIDVKQGVYYGWEDRDFQKQENQVGTIKLEHDLTDNLTITNTAVYNKSKNDYLWTNPDDSQGNIYKNGNVWARVNSRIADTDTFTDQLALTGKFNTGALKHSFNLGAEYSDQETDRTQYILNGLSTTGAEYNKCSPADIASGWCTSVQNPNRGPWTGSISTEGADQYNTQTKSTSVYFLDSIEFNPQWILDLGLRWDKFDTEQTMTYGARNSAVLGSSTTPPTRQVGEQVKTESDTDFFTYQAGLTFKPVENGSIYASYATSANPVGVDAGDGSEGIGAAYSNLDPEESQTFEIGTKWDLLQDRLNLTAAIFRTEKQNARIQLSPTTYSNIGESKVDGIELGLNGKITDKWDISAGYTYLDSEATKNGVSCRGTTCTDQTVFNGNQMPNVPKNSATLWTTYQVLPQLQLGAGATAMDKVYGDLANTKYVPGYVRYDAMARYNVNENVDLQLNVNNLSDERYFTKAYASHYATEAEGRSAVLSLNFKY